MLGFLRDLLAAAGAYTVCAYFGHPNLGGGLASIAVMAAVAMRLPGVYSPGDAGSLGPHDGPLLGQAKPDVPYPGFDDRLE